MYLHELKLWNFRKYGTIGDNFESSEPGLKVKFRNGVNVLVGENDSGKTTIVDAIRYVLRTQSLEYIQIEEKDFHQNPATNLRTTEMKIECTFKGFSDTEAGHFLEWIGFEEKEDGQKEYILKVWLYARVKDNSIYQYVRAGVDIEGSYIEGEARDLLRTVYLKPLRDALSEMTHGNKSRLAQILRSHSAFKKEKDEHGNEILHELEDKYSKLKKEVDSFFDISKTEKGKVITETVNQLLGEKFLLGKDSRRAGITLTGSELSDILKQLDLILENNKSGLGSLNLLFIAAELLLFEDANTAFKLTLIEELEAHLHPQYQLRLIDFINTQNKYGQFILTTHSTTLASKIDLNSLLICNDKYVFPMGEEYTNLKPTDYSFLERFLDATKANLFFAKGVIIVEGDAENLLIPTIAEIIGRPLHKYGISIVNVGSTAFKRYANIFVRKEVPLFNVNVAILSDLDIRSLEYYEGSVPTVTVVNDNFIDKLKAISQDINYSNIPEFFSTKTEFETFIQSNKTIARFPNQPTGQLSIKERLVQIFDSELQTELNEVLLTSLREEKKERIESQWNDKLPVKIYLPEQWTLEYEIASSKLYKYLCQAIELAKIEKSNPYFSVNDSDFSSIKATIDRLYSAEFLTDKQGIFNIFQPVCNSAVSKAIVAQYLAQILIKEKELGVNVEEMILTDLQLKYIVDAICYVTEPMVAEPENQE
jgi:putative ATP-dependent endonuclease of OLD family